MAGLAALKPIQTNEAEVVSLNQLARIFASPDAPCLIGANGEQIILPESLFRALREAVRYLQQGDAVTISPLHCMLTTTQAGDFLGVSRQHLTRLIDAGKIECERVGRHRRIKLKDVLEYRAKRSAERRAVFAEMAANDAADGEYE